jgi:surface protein
MKDLFHLPVHFSRQFIALCLALLTLFATPASGQFLSDGVTPVNPIPNSNAILLAHIGNCLAEQPVTGLCTTWGDNSGFGAIPSWDVTNVNDFGNAFLNRTTFNGDLSRWNMINATSLYRMFQNALAFNRDISQWTVSNVRNFDGTFYIAQAFNQDISGWDTSAATDMKNMFQQANAFNQDIRKWTVAAERSPRYRLVYKLCRRTAHPNHAVLENEICHRPQQCLSRARNL